MGAGSKGSGAVGSARGCKKNPQLHCHNVSRSSHKCVSLPTCPQGPDTLYSSMVFGLSFSALISRPGFSVLRSWLLSGETPVSGTYASRGKIGHTWSFPTQLYSDPAPSSSSFLPQKPHRLQSPWHQEYIKKDHLGWKQFTTATAHFPDVCLGQKLPEANAQPGVP